MLYRLALAYGATGQREEWNRTVAKLQEAPKRAVLKAYYLGEIAVDVAEDGNIDSAVTIARAIDDWMVRGDALLRIGALRISRGDSEGCIQMCQRTDPDLAEIWPPELLLSVVRKQVDEGDLAPALATADLIQDPCWGALALAELARGQHETGATVGANRHFNEALKLARSVTDSQFRADAIFGIGRVLRECNEDETAARAFEEAAQTVKNVEGYGSEPIFFSVDMLLEIAKVHIDHGDFSTARRFLARAWEATIAGNTTRTLVSSWKFSAYHRILEAYVCAKDVKAALGIARWPANEYQRSMGYGRIGLAEASRGRALAALHWVDSLGSAETKARVLVKIACGILVHARIEYENPSLRYHVVP